MGELAANPIEVRRRFLSGRRLALLFVFAIFVGVAAWIVNDQIEARSKLKRAKVTLSNDEPQVARELMKSYIETFPSDAEGHFLAAQATRRCGDFEHAEGHLHAAQQHGWNPSAIELERAMIAAQTGNLRSVEPLLLQAVHENHSESAQVLAVLVPALIAEFRWVEARVFAEKWTDLRPQCAQAWARRGEILERLRRKGQSVDALREAVRLDPNDRKSRFSLATLLLEIRQSLDEASVHLRWLQAGEPNNLAVDVQYAVCREAQGYPNEAAMLLTQLIAAHPRDPKALYFRGRLELTRGNGNAALPLLRQASILDPSDPEILYSLLLAAREVGGVAEVAEVQKRLDQCNADLKRVAELGRSISASPRDPDLRREMGELFLKNGREQEGISWLKSALREQSDHRPTHRLLAEYYRRTGESALAEFHHTFVELKPGP